MGAGKRKQWEESQKSSIEATTTVFTSNVKYWWNVAFQIERFS
jgi:hypothetical protein